MNKRLRELRKELKLTQAEFGEKIGLSNFAISDMEKGKTQISLRNINLICEKFRINEDWLRYGIGDKYAPALPVDDISMACAGIVKDKHEQIKQILIMYDKLDENGKIVANEFIELCINQLQKRQDKEE